MSRGHAVGNGGVTRSAVTGRDKEDGCIKMGLEPQRIDKREDGPLGL